MTDPALEIRQVYLVGGQSFDSYEQAAGHVQWLHRREEARQLLVEAFPTNHDGRAETKAGRLIKQITSNPDAIRRALELLS